MRPEDVVHVLRRTREALVPGGIVLDLQVIRPNPMVEIDGRSYCEADGTPLFETADPARAAVDRLIDEGLLLEEAVDDHDVLEHFTDGAALVEHWATKKRSLPPEEIPTLRAVDRPVAVRERCRLRSLRRTDL